MTEFINLFMFCVSVFFIIYLILYSSFLFFSVVAGAVRLYKRECMQKIRNELKHEYYIPISILVPAYNEEVTIADNIKSLLNLDYKLYEIIVVDDGSKDNTSSVLIEEFKMQESHRPVHLKLHCQPVINIYETLVGNIKLTLIRKKNGGKGDALNMGINASQYPYFICIDADSMLQKDSLEKIIQPVLEDDSIVAVGGLIRVAQCIEIQDGEIKGYNFPRNPIICMQVVEYDRSFLASRILMDMFNGNLIISGAFGLFKKSIVVSAGGYSSETLGEDMELVVKMHVYCRNNNIDYSIYYEPNAICWSQAPTTLKDLKTQRRRWHLGLFQSLFIHRQVFGNLKFGPVSFISYTYYLLFELLSPFVEVFGILTIILAVSLGMLNIGFMLQYFAIYTIYWAVLTLTAFFQRIYTQNLSISFFDTIKVILFCILETGFFRYVVSFVRLTAFMKYKKRKKSWGSIQRVKQNEEKSSNG